MYYTAIVTYTRNICSSRVHDEGPTNKKKYVFFRGVERADLLGILWKGNHSKGKAKRNTLT